MSRRKEAPQHLHYELDTGIGDSIQVTLDKGSNVLLLTSSQYEAWKKGEQTSIRGGHASTSPVTLKPPYSGHWHVVVQPDGEAVKASCSLIRSTEQ